MSHWRAESSGGKRAGSSKGNRAESSIDEGAQSSINASVPSQLIPLSNQLQPEQRIKQDLCRLTRFGANISDAHSCFIFLPAQVLPLIGLAHNFTGSFDPNLVLVAFHSLSSDVIKNCVLARGSGLIGWVATHNRSIHVSPFELDSRTLGIYNSNQNLKSFIGVPIALSTLGRQLELGRSPSNPNQQSTSGVIACDSKKSFAFSKLQGKLLEELAQEVASVVELHSQINLQDEQEQGWQIFLRQCEAVMSALGSQAVELLRLRLTNFDHLEAALGTSQTLTLCDQTLRLIQQAIPPHFPISRLVNGDVLIFLDSMMSSFYQNKIMALSGHVGSTVVKPEFQFARANFRDKKRKAVSIEGLVALTGALTATDIQSGESPLVPLKKELPYGRRRN